MSFDKTIGFVGAGNMAEALIRGLTQPSGSAPPTVPGERVTVADPIVERVAALGERYGVRGAASNAEVAKGAEVLVLAVKPQIMDRALSDIADHVRDDALVISIAAGVAIHTIESRLRPGTRVIRTMPNTPALVQHGATAIAPGRHATEADLELARLVFDAVGISIALEERHLDAVTGLSGSGPAYVFLMLEALADGGVRVGLPRQSALRLATQTVLGAAALLLETGKHPGQLKDMVTSPGGTTIAGVHALERGGLRATLMSAVQAATERSRELGRAAGGSDGSGEQ